MLSLLQRTALALCLHCAEISWLLPSSVLTLVTTMGLKFGQFKLAAAMARQWRGRQTRGNWGRGHHGHGWRSWSHRYNTPHQGGGLSEGGCNHLTVYNHETISYWIYHMIPFLSIYISVHACSVCLKCTEFVILCLYNSTNRVYIIHQIKSK